MLLFLVPEKKDQHGRGEDLRKNVDGVLLLLSKIVKSHPAGAYNVGVSLQAKMAMASNTLVCLKWSRRGGR